jgi:hypothetical protein
MKQNLTYILLAAIIAGLSQYSVAQKVGTSSMQFLKVMPTARATAMGDAFATLASGADAVFWNPSGIIHANGLEIASTMTLWIFDSRQTAFAAAMPLGGDMGNIGIQLQYVDYGKMEETTVGALGFVGTGDDKRYLGFTGRTFSPYAYVLGVSYANRFTDKFSTGLTVKYVNESLFGSSSVSVTNPTTGESKTYHTYANVLLFDFGMLYNTGYRSIAIGIAVQNFGSSVQFAEEAFPAPLSFRLGASVDLLGSNALFIENQQSRVTMAYDIFQPNDYAQQMHVGLEYVFNNMFALRTGYKSNYDSEKLTYGAGIRTDLEGYGLSFDYSYAGMGDYLNNVHRISLGVVVK